MNSDSSQYYIEDTLLLKFLISRYSEMLRLKEPKLPIWIGLGMVALHQNRELESAFKTLISSDSYTGQEILTRSIDLFLAELQRLGAVETTDYQGKSVERRSLSERTSRKFLFWCWGEGRKMRKEMDFRFYPVWEFLSWLALPSDEYIEEFDSQCRFSEKPVEERLEEGLDIVKCAIFREKRNRSQPFSIIEYFQKQNSKSK